VSATTGVRRAPRWSVDALRALRESPACPVCEVNAVADRFCRACGADFTEIGDELWQVSQSAADALEARQGVLDRVPLRPRVAPAAAPRAVATPPTSRPGSSATVQSVLALAGAGLVAVAAIVFTFFNPDLTDRAVRGAIVAAITVVFLLGARVLMRRGLRFSAEAVGALGIVFVGLDVSSVAELTPAGQSPWVLAAVGTLIAGAAMGALGAVVRLRVWLWAAVVGVSLVPVMFGVAAGPGVGLPAGALATAGAAFALMSATDRLSARFDGRLRAERIALTVVQIAFVAIAVPPVWVPDDASGLWVTTGALAAAAVLALLSARHPAGAFWSFVAGSAGVAAAAMVPLAVASTSTASSEWVGLAAVPAAAAVGLVAVGALVPTPHPVLREPFHAGALAAIALASMAPVSFAGLLGSATVWGVDSEDDLFDPAVTGATATGLASVAIGLIAFGLLSIRRGENRRWVAQLGAWSGMAAALVTLTSTSLPLWVRVALGLSYAVGLSLAVMLPRLLSSSAAARLPLIAGAHAALILAGLLSWRDDAVVVWAGTAVVATVALLARTLPAAARFWHVGVGYAYALVVFGTALHQLGLGSIALLCLTTAVGGIAAIVATFVPAVRPRAWWAVLVVTAVPFAIGVAQVVFERSGWTALSTAVIFALALTLVHTRRPGLGAALRTLAGAVLVPALAVVAVCLGAQFLEVSGSPVVLPVIAALVALVLPSLPTIRDALVGRVGETGAAAAERGIEASTLLTAAIAVALSLARESAGLGTTLVVLTILGVGAGAAALWGRRRYGWWLAGAALTGALWCGWALSGVDAFEPYVLPPTLGAAIIGLVLTARGGKGRAIYCAGLVLAVVPVAVLLAISGSGSPVAGRTYGLVVAAWVLAGIGMLLGRGDSRIAERLRGLRVPTFAVAVAAGAAGAVQAVRWGFALDTAPLSATPDVLLFLALGAAGAIPAALAGRALRRGGAAGSPLASSRWLLAPAVLYIAAAAWPAIHRDWFTIWTMWALMVAALAIMLVVAVRDRSRATGLPPVWFFFVIAFATAVVAWSPRDLRVEWFSLPLGAFLLVAGATALAESTAGGDAAARPRLSDWPRGWRGSWALLAPGLLVMLSASIAATYTDPLTWRAILVIVVALAAILVGAGARVAAPFVIGIVVLPVENVLAFMVQIGRGIESMPWWITLSVVGAVLLIIAVTYERRDGEGEGIAARLRDLA